MKRYPLIEEAATSVSPPRAFHSFKERPLSFFLDSGMDPQKLGRYSFIGSEAVERGLALDDLLRAEEAFLTNSLIELMPLTRVEGEPLGTGRVGRVSKMLVAAYKGLVKQEI